MRIRVYPVPPIVSHMIASWLLVYMIKKLFRKKKVKGFQEDPVKDLRGGSKMKLVNKTIIKKILKDKALKIALLAIFTTAGIRHFQSELEGTLLIEDAVIPNVDREFKVVCDIVENHNLDLHTKSVQSLIDSKVLNQGQKIDLLKLKLDLIINGECASKTQFLVLTILGLLLTFTTSGVSGLTLLLEALYRLFQEGKIGEALYRQILKALAIKWGAENIPTDLLI